MTVDGLSVLVGYLAALSAVTERGVEVIKGLIKWLDAAKTDPAQERKRKLILRIISIVVGTLSALLAAPATSAALGGETDVLSWPGCLWTLALGILASAGSGFWNPILGYLKAVKDLKKTAEVKMRLELLDLPGARAAMTEEARKAQIEELIETAGLRTA